MPHSYYSKVVKEELGKELGPLHSYGTGIVFLPSNSTEKVAKFKELFSNQSQQLGYKVIGFRTLATDNSSLGETSKSTEPHMIQVFIENSKTLPWKQFDAELYRLRRLCEYEISHCE
jgi:glutamate synthase domain-containing protein 1